MKGALKTMLLRKSGDSDVYCILGGEVGQGPEGASAVSIGPATPVFVPAPSPSLGLVYVTTPYLLSRAASATEPWRADEAGKLAEAAKRASSLAVGEALVPEKVGGGVLQAGPSRLSVKASGEVGEAARVLGEMASDLNPLYEAHPIEERLVLVGESSGRSLVDKLLLRLTRVRLDRQTKTVQRGALWTEEYIAPGTLMVSPVFDTGFRNSFCMEKGGGLKVEDAVGTLKRKLSEPAGSRDDENESENNAGNVFYLVLGGKESVGAGLVKAKIFPGG